MEAWYCLIANIRNNADICIRNDDGIDMIVAIFITDMISAKILLDAS